ncbi:MAG: Protein translocase subunit SecY [candidate division WWE3 bacterium GW2011_GWB1_41_6]|uniref:Protein translocase subunit SecY n=1 Tax=candidate division WWE3 bacterium GW2011_GWB1_41_6 TaxID=1619112 RepID=A0A0G0WXI6_UNCKA|nr:MAG: Protein translocase subunit SecY [candidate division WWE3 bacterium GW2011_GWB1_41_6]
MTNILFRFPELRRRIVFSVMIIFIFRLLAHIPVPGVDTSALKSYLEGNSILGLFDLFSGGGLQNFSIVTLGLNPYINASIVLQLFTMMIPSLEELSKEGESGREKINMYTRFLTVPFALLQSYGMYFLLNRQEVINSLNVVQLIILILTLTAGSMLLMWIGELVTEYGIGNGISMLIFVGIISRLPISIVQFVSTIETQSFINVLIFAALTLLIIAGVVLVNEGTRNIPIEYGRAGVRSQKVRSYLPIKINQAGVIPIIFAVSVVLLPSMIAGPLQATTNPTLQEAGRFLAANFTESGILYNVLYFLLVFGFTYFYTSVQFNPQKISDDVKKRGGFISGIRPGSATTRYLKDVINRITLAGAMFLGLVAIMPFLLQVLGGLSNFAIGGTGLLIVVSVVLETIRQVQSYKVTRNYQSFLD